MPFSVRVLVRGLSRHTVSMIAVAFAALFLCCKHTPLQQGTGAQVRVRRADATEQTLVESVRTFVRNWLVQRNVESAFAWFNNAALGNEVLLRASCAGYIAEEDTLSPPTREAGIREFLTDFSREFGGQQLVSAAHNDVFSETLAELGDRILNDTTVDSFVVVKFPDSELRDSESYEDHEDEYLRTHLPPVSFISFVPVGGGMTYFIWVPEGDSWRIYHANMVCM